MKITKRQRAIYSKQRQEIRNLIDKYKKLIITMQNNDVVEFEVRNNKDKFVSKNLIVLNNSVWMDSTQVLYDMGIGKSLTCNVCKPVYNKEFCRADCFECIWNTKETKKEFGFEVDSMCNNNRCCTVSYEELFGYEGLHKEKNRIVFIEKINNRIKDLEKVLEVTKEYEK